MENKIFSQATKFLRERRDNRRWRIVVCCLAVFVVCGTAWILSRNGQALVSSGAILDCPVVVHAHTADCFDSEGRQICGEADYVFHTHDDYCYDMNGQLVCELEEVEEHEHTADCFETISILSCGYETIPVGESSIENTNVTSENGSAEGEWDTSVNALGSSGEDAALVCGMEEHTHSDECYGPGERSLICDQEEGGHAHDDSCYEEVAEEKLTCGEEESEEEGGHKHNSDCYEKSTEKKLVCGQEESYHQHSEDCYGEAGEAVLICGKTEHIHSDECYGTQQGSGEQVSGGGTDVEEPQGHVHDESCTQKVRKLVCGKKGAHIHSSEECYDGDKLICEVPAVRSVEVHEHDEKCFQAGADEEFKKIYRDDQIVVTAVYTGLAQIPEAAALRVEMIPKDSSDYEKDLAKLTETEGALVEDSDLAMLLRIGFYTADERIRPKDTVHFTVQFLDDSLCKKGNEVTVACVADGGVELIAAADIDEENATEFDLKEFADLDIGIIIGGEHDRKRVLTYEGAGYIMSIALEENTKISKDAELTIDQLTQENSPEGYAERLAQLEKTDGILAGEDDMAMLLRVWISDNGTDTGLEEKAEVSVRFLDDKIYAEGDAVMVASFADDGVRLISGTDIDKEGTTTFAVEELSELAFLAPGERAGVLTYEGEDYIVTVTLGEDTRIPVGTELMVEEITKESDPALYAERLAQLKSVDGVIGEEETIAHLLHMWVVLDGEEIMLDETVDVNVQFVNSRFYFEGDAVKAAHFIEEDGQQYLTMLDASAIDTNISTSFVSEGLNDFAFVVNDAYTMVYEGDGFIVTVRFKDAAKIPEDAKLIAKRITEESDPEEFTAREDQLQDEITDELIALGALFEIGFYDADGEEIEPQDVVDVKIQLLDRSTIEEADSIKVAHFAKDAENEGESVEIIKEVDVTEDGDGSLSTSFQTESFSQYAITVNGEVINESTFRKAMKMAQNGPEGEVKLQADIVFTKKNSDIDGEPNGAVQLTSGHTVTLDLNGYTITVDAKDGNVTLVDIYGTLNVIDSSVRGRMTKDVSGGAAQPTFAYDSKTHHLKTMTCSVTESDVIDQSRGATREVTYTYTVTEHGAIVGSGNETSPLLYVKGGKLNVSDGVILAESKNRAIEASGGAGTVELNECYLVGNTATPGNGGGAVYCGDGSIVNIHDGAVISGNKGRQGGGIYVGASTINMDGGYITNNTTTFGDDLSGQYGGGGGGILLRNSSILMQGGYITGNKVYTGGGGISIEGDTAKNRKIEGGFISSNSCLGPRGDGAGIAVYDKSSIIIDAATGKKVYITNNEVKADGDWGGAGIFVGENSTANLYNTLITNNTADGFGGGLSGCSTGRIINGGELRGAAIFDNTALGTKQSGYSSSKKEDKTYTENNPAFWELDGEGRYYFQDCFTALYTELDNTMLGGGFENWDGSIDGERIDTNAGHWASSYIAGLTAYPSSESKNGAINAANVYINGNHSVVHGGGIMCNGIMVIGERNEIEIPSAMELKAKKKLVEANGKSLDMTDKQFSFAIYSDETCQNLVTTGTNDKAGNISFDEFLTFDLREDCDFREGPDPTGKYTYTYYIKEEAADEISNMQIQSDSTVYRMTVTVEKIQHGTMANNSNIKKFIDDITSVVLEKKVGDSWNEVYKNTNPGSNEKHAIVVNLDSNKDALFINKKSSFGKMKVEKSWDGYKDGYGPGSSTFRIQWVSVGLNYNGILQDVQKLSDENDWCYEWDLGKPFINDEGNEVDPTSWDRDLCSVREMMVGYLDAPIDRNAKTVAGEIEPWYWVFVSTYKYENINSDVAKVTITNTPKEFGFKIGKVGNKNEPVQGAQFQIFDVRQDNTLNPDAPNPRLLEFEHVSDGYALLEGASSGTARTTTILRTNIEGVINISGLWWGEYLIHEYEAPVGYKPVHDHIVDFSGGTATEKVWCVLPDGSRKQNGWPDKEGENYLCDECAVLQSFLNVPADRGSDKFDYDPNNDVLIWTMIDPEDKYELPKTGGFGKDYIFIIGAIACFGIAVVTYTVYRRRKGA